jgi:hypothetical protein
MIDGMVCLCEPVGLGFEIRDPDCPLSDEQHARQRAQEIAYWKAAK